MRPQLVSTLAVLAGCGPSIAVDVAEARSAVVIGEDDLVSVDEDGGNVPERYRALLDAIGLLAPLDCTASHIGGGLVLTAGHCLAGVDCSELLVRWALRGSRAGSTSRCVEVLAAAHDGGADYAVLRVSPIPGAAIPIAPCSAPAPGTAVTIFSHPEQKPLAWSNTCMIEPGAAAGRGGIEFAHACDTRIGSSGAPVIDDTTLRVVGIHDGGFESWNYGTFVSPIPYFDPARLECWCADRTAGGTVGGGS